VSTSALAPLITVPCGSLYELQRARCSDSGKRCGPCHNEKSSWLQVVFVGKRLPYVLAAVSADGFLRLWNVKQAQLVAEVQVSQNCSLTAVCVDPGQTHLVVSDSAGFMYTYSIAAWKGGKNKHQVPQLCARLCICPQARCSLLAAAHYMRLLDMTDVANKQRQQILCCHSIIFPNTGHRNVS